MIHDQTLRWGKVISTLDLSVANNLPLVLVESTPENAPKPRSTKTPRTRKRNV